MDVVCDRQRCGIETHDLKYFQRYVVAMVSEIIHKPNRAFPQNSILA